MRLLSLLSCPRSRKCFGAAFAINTRQAQRSTRCTYWTRQPSRSIPDRSGSGRSALCRRRSASAAKPTRENPTFFCFSCEFFWSHERSDSRCRYATRPYPLTLTKRNADSRSAQPIIEWLVTISLGIPDLETILPSCQRQFAADFQFHAGTSRLSRPSRI